MSQLVNRSVDYDSLCGWASLFELVLQITCFDPSHKEIFWYYEELQTSDANVISAGTPGISF